MASYRDPYLDNFLDKFRSLRAPNDRGEFIREEVTGASLRLRLLRRAAHDSDRGALVPGPAIAGRATE